MSMRPGADVASRKDPCIVVVLAVLAVQVSPAALAVSLTPRVSGGYQDYEIEFADVTLPNQHPFTQDEGIVHVRDGFDLSDRLSFVGPGLTIAQGRLFFDVSGQWSSTGEDHTDQLQGGINPIGIGSVGHEHLLDARFSRHEANASMGWGFSPDLSLYIGYKHADLGLTNALTPVLTPVADFGPRPGDVLFFGNRDIDFRYKGPFIGASYALPVRSRGSLQFQASVAFLNAQFHDRFVGNAIFIQNVFAPSGAVIGQVPVPITDLSLYDSTIHGRSRGLNLGVAWTSDLGWVSEGLRAFSYTIGLDRSEYKFSTSQSATGNFQETSTRLRLDLRYRFSTTHE